MVAQIVRWVAVSLAAVAAASLTVAGVASSAGSARPCSVTVQRPQHIAPQGVSGTASVRCAGRQSRVSLVVEVLRVPLPPHRPLRVAIRRTGPASVQAHHAYTTTAQTAECVARPPFPYATQATLTVGGQTLVWRSQAVHIACNKPADDRCQVTAHAPRIVNHDLVGPADFTCASDRTDLIWRVDLQELSGGDWQSAGSRMIERQTLFQGGRTYAEAAQQACANEVGPWPERLRTVIQLRRTYGGTINQTSPVASLTCPNKTSTLTVQLTSSSGGRVTSSPAGIDCPGPSGPPVCSHDFPAGAQVTLTATAASGFTFTGWQADCSGSADTCTLTMDTDKTAVAGFKPMSGPPA